ncbi:uncharacterized protein MYCFIDRAFT_173702 [Pseudocercospora fijiensis CIRAD86]|uniref:Uncharacterized protein n=1 Tax=Pseudocercospora fijiensis (strain CIRAD86) TaxID=383855 RepID=M2Z4R0_PSEFD|nr:uncharacterized protein MYCFIDRAFT_173702 [Pseudocercospora fijiensis CIRAD86]EME84775.1 hypothetical protein MYCFIDRAFT_173702 [Pseudocercospora fijiensis CIRAD86]
MTRVRIPMPSNQEHDTIGNSPTAAVRQAGLDNNQGGLQAVTRLYTQLGRHRSAWLCLQAQRAHVMQEYQNGRRFFEDSMSLVCDVLATDNSIDGEDWDSAKAQLLEDGRTIRARSESVKEVEKRIASVEWAIGQVESQIMTGLMRLVPEMPSAAKWVSDLRESSTDDESCSPSPSPM